MNEIGEKLREARESHGVSIEEAAEDLKIRPSQLKNLEEGNIKEFKDIFYVKFFIRDYAKYLGLDGEKILDDLKKYLSKKKKIKKFHLLIQLLIKRNLMYHVLLFL